MYKGSVKPLIGYFKSDNYFGRDGFGDTNLSMEITKTINQSKTAALALIDLTKKHAGKIYHCKIIL